MRSQSKSAKKLTQEVHRHLFLDDRIERINLDAKILLNPAEKQFDAPTEFVELGDHRRRLKKVVGQKREVMIVLSIEKKDPPQRLGIFDFIFGAGQGDGLVE